MEKLQLPVLEHVQEIAETVAYNQVTIIVGGTGTGKSTQVPQILLNEGYRIVVTEPRRLAARTLADRVAMEIGEELGGTVGYKTAEDGVYSKNTRCLFATDGLALIRELMQQNSGVLVIDEAHEWNENIEVLVAWCKLQIKNDPTFKLVIMSATLESEKLSAFFDGAPVISIPGRLFPITEKNPEKVPNDLQKELVLSIVDLIQEGHEGILVFVPGKKEIDEIIGELKKNSTDGVILPLHGQLTPEEQGRCFEIYDRAKIVISTNVAQTSVTVPGITAVVDSGLERRTETVNGVEGLYLRSISKADSAQRKGRAGRTAPGVYVCHSNTSEMPEYPTPEIMRKRLDLSVLRLAIAGVDMAELEFFHQPSHDAILEAKRALVVLGCLTNKGEVTKIGFTISRFPISVKYGRMLVEADRLGVLDDVLTVASILEVKGITAPLPSINNPERPDWRLMVPDEKDSDIMAQLKVWKMAEKMSRDQMLENGVSLKNLHKAREIRNNLSMSIRQFFESGTNGRREDILKSVTAGMVDHLFKRGIYGGYVDGGIVSRDINTGSVTLGSAHAWIVGEPFDLHIKTKRGNSKTLNLINMITKVELSWLFQIAPHLVEKKHGLNPYFSRDQNVVLTTSETWFNGQKISEEEVPDYNHPNKDVLKYEASQYRPRPNDSSIEELGKPIGFFNRFLGR